MFQLKSQVLDLLDEIFSLSHPVLLVCTAPVLERQNVVDTPHTVLEVHCVLIARILKYENKRAQRALERSPESEDF